MAALVSQALAAGLPGGCLITDVGSVKRAPHLSIPPLLAGRGMDFIGSHPMAGSERTGLAAAAADLFHDAACLLTNDEGAPVARAEALERFWQSVGCRTSWMSAASHDALVARISHLPHIVAASAARICLQNPADGRFGGGGLRDTTRVASGNPEMWAEILIENRAALLEPLRETIADLGMHPRHLEHRRPGSRAAMAGHRQTSARSAPPTLLARFAHSHVGIPSHRHIHAPRRIHAFRETRACPTAPPSSAAFPTESAPSAISCPARIASTRSTPCKPLGASCEVLDELAGYGPVNLRIHGQSMQAERAVRADRLRQLGHRHAPARRAVSRAAVRRGTCSATPRLSSRPMGRITVPLGQMGAHIESRGEKPGCAPLRIHPAKLTPITYEMPVASAQVKSAVSARRTLRRGQNHGHPAGRHPRPHRAHARLVRRHHPPRVAMRSRSTAGKSP